MDNLMYVTYDKFAEMMYFLDQAEVDIDTLFFCSVREYLIDRKEDIACDCQWVPFAYTTMGNYLQVAYHIKAEKENQ
jgi:hypothetical protein